MALLSYRAKGVIKLRTLRGGVYSGLRKWAYLKITCVLVREMRRGLGQIHRGKDAQKRRRQCDHRGKDWTDAVTSLEPPEAGRGKRQILPEAFRGVGLW